MPKPVSPSALARLSADIGELVAAHTDAKTARDLTRYATDPVGFSRDVLGVEPWAPKQIEVLESVRDHRQTVVRGGNGLGKDFAVACLALWWIFAAHPATGIVLLTGPTQRQIEEVLMRGEIRRAWARGDLPGELGTKALRLPDGRAAILAFTSSDMSNLGGLHGAHIFAAITEAQGTPDFFFDALAGNAVGAEDRVLAVGNPFEPSGKFYEANRTNSTWHAIRISAFDHPNIISGRRVIPGGPEVEWLAQVRREEGEGSRFWVSRVLGEFPETATDSLLKREWVEAAVRRWGGPFMVAANGQPPVVALDVARFGSDSSCLCVVQGPVVKSLETWDQAPVTETAGKVIAKLRELGVKPTLREPAPFTDPAAWGTTDGTVVVDAALVGGGAVDLLREAGYAVTEFNGAARAPVEPERYLNLRAFAYWELRRAFEENRVAIPPDALLIEELEAVRYSYTPKGGLQVEKKTDLRRRLGRSTDRADALAMALGAGIEAHSIGGAIIDF